MLFEKNTFILKKWVVFSNQMNKTEVLLENLRLNETIEKKNFKLIMTTPDIQYGGIIKH